MFNGLRRFDCGKVFKFFRLGIIELIDFIMTNGKQSRELQHCCKVISLMKELRVAYASQFVIGVCGPQNAGKSTFINTFGFNAEVGVLEHTTETTVYQLPDRKNVMLVDFPGSTSILNHTDTFLSSGHIPNFYVFVSPYTGTPDKIVIENIF